ncbi:PfkB domain protein [metagenome]|uniref:Ribokinase n=1 Tax=metagenome TaxID=256318 RepID=A0A2P2BZM3_9ZZZZ
MVGSANLDLAIGVLRPPARGETVLGGDPVRGPGGKGLNQAVAAARLGLRTGFVGAVGDDDAGALLLGVLRAEGVSSLVSTVAVPTGLAVVLTDEQGDSTITVSPGANARVDAALVWAVEEVAAARAVLLQHEVPPSAVRAAAERCTGLFVLNPAPGRIVDPDVLARVDVLVPNRHELAVLAGASTPPQDADAAALARRLQVRGTVVVTLGADGCVVVEPDGTTYAVAARPVRVVDTTAAGDSFCAGLVHGLLRGDTMLESVRWATRVAGQTVGVAGAAVSTPRLDEVPAEG